MTLDAIDKRILTHLQKDGAATIAELSEVAGVSATPIWKRLRKLEDAGILKGRVALLDQKAIGLALTGFVLIRTRDHSEEWLQKFAHAIAEIDEIVEVHRMAGDIDYLLKVVAPDVEGYDAIYKRLIGAVDLSDVSASFSMEVVKATTALPLDHAKGSSASTRVLAK